MVEEGRINCYELVPLMTRFWLEEDLRTPAIVKSWSGGVSDHTDCMVTVRVGQKKVAKHGETLSAVASRLWHTTVNTNACARVFSHDASRRVFGSAPRAAPLRLEKECIAPPRTMVHKSPSTCREWACDAAQ